MLLFRVNALRLAASFSISAGVAVAQEVPDPLEFPEPGTRWVYVYGWVQAGEKLVKAEQWPLALGSFVEAEAKLKKLKADAPDFEPEMVAYRLNWLAKEIEEMQGNLGGGDHDIMTKFLDFIESFEQGQSERFNNEFEKAYDTLTIAKVLLDEIISERPFEFKVAMETQYDMLLDSLIWLGSQLNFKASFSRKPVVVDTNDWGTTEFVDHLDMPASEGTVVLSSRLFPPTQVNIAVAPFQSELSDHDLPLQSETEDEREPLPTFRMSSKQDLNGGGGSQ